MQHDNNMDVPVKNKESLDAKETLIVSKLKYKIAIWTAVFSFLGLVVTNAIPLVERVLTSKEKTIQKKAEEQQMVSRLLDSIAEEKGKEAVKETFNNMANIYHEMGRIQRLLPRSSSIVIYSTHDSGGIPRSGSPLHVTVLYEANNKDLPFAKEYWQSRAMPEGYFQFARNIYERGEFYMEDVANYPGIYNRETKEDMDYNGTKSVYGKLIKSTPTSVYYLAIGYSQTNPIETFSPNLRNIARVYASKFEKLLQSNSETWR